jgi:hypothetical protein
MLEPVAVVFPNSACRDVVLLGTGFSRALSEDMPLTDKLGDLIVEDLQYEGLIPDELVPQGLPELSPSGPQPGSRTASSRRGFLAWPRTSTISGKRRTSRTGASSISVPAAW